MKSILTKNQNKKVVFNNKMLEGEKVDLILNIRYDDECGNGHNSFSMTADIYEAGKRGDKSMLMCGCCHDEIKQIAPEYNKYLKWHLMSSDAPMHYIANTIYWATKQDKHTNFVYLKDDEFNFEELIGIYDEEEIQPIKNKYGENNIIVKVKQDDNNREANLEYARSSAIAPEATLEQLQSEEWLKERLPQLQKDFKKVVEELGFIF